MTIEQLMQPRYMVIADYPASMLPVGFVIVLEGSNEWVKQHKEFYDSYPAIFRPMPWYEGRKVEEMPAYLSMITLDGTIYFKVNRYEEYYVYDAEIPHESYLAYSDELMDCAPMVFCNPATEQEYIGHINKTK